LSKSPKGIDQKAGMMMLERVMLRNLKSIKERRDGLFNATPANDSGQ
jgi:hypothetical protein